MPSIEQIKASISGLSPSDQADVLLHVLRLKYGDVVQEIRDMASSANDEQPGEALENLTYDELLERLRLLEGIREGLSEVAEKRVISHEEVKKRFESWRRK